jgi:hypothetical protein
MADAMMTATTMATVQQRWQQQSTTSGSKRNGGSGRGNGGSIGNGGDGDGNCGGSGGSHYTGPPVKGRGDHCSDHCCQVSAAATTISTASAWMPWLKYRRLEGLF